MAKKEEGISEKAVHTKGPWTFEFDADGDHAIFAGTKLIAVTVGLNHFSREEDEANAALLAASPDLLAELEHAHDMIRHYLKCGYLPHMSAEEAEQLVRNPDSAIRKARGEKL